MQLVGQIIYSNIYSAPAGGSAETGKEPQASLREGVLLLHRGGLASCRWVKYGWVHEQTSTTHRRLVANVGASFTDMRSASTQAS